VPVNKTWIRIASEMHLAMYRLSNGFLGGNVMGVHVLLLTAKGRKTGREHTTPLTYLEDGGSYVVIASNGGNVDHPGWYRNLRRNPEAEVQVGSARKPVRAEDVTGEERDRLYERAIAVFRGYEQYQKEAPRTIPVVRLVPVEKAGNESRGAG
jgi:deazaflavin-dependent oxidoreductase (nitroreductase family)